MKKLIKAVYTFKTSNINKVEQNVPPNIDHLRG